MARQALEGGVPSIPEFRPVHRSVFAERAQRLRTLAPGHAIEGYLAFAAALAEAQNDELERPSEIDVPDDRELERCRAHGLPTLSIGAERSSAWRDGLGCLLASLDAQSLPAEAARTVAELRAADASALERDAASLLAGTFDAIDPRRQPFIAAALQVHWTKRALALGEPGRSAKVDYGLCPVCGSPPAVSAVRSGGEHEGLRYLVCSLCASEWHVVRIKCSACASTQRITYLLVEGANDAVRAECCGDCRTYLKILYFDKDNRLEPCADDLATLALDMLVDARGFRRVGPNLLLAPGSVQPDKVDSTTLDGS